MLPTQALLILLAPESSRSRGAHIRATPNTMNLPNLIWDRLSTRPRASRRYVFATILVLVALATRMLIAPIEGGIQYVTFFPAVALSAVVGGFLPGLFAATFGMVLATYFFWPPYYSFQHSLHGETVLANVVFLLDALLVCSAIETMHRLRDKSGEDNERFRLFMDNGPTLAWMKDSDGRYLYANRAYEELLGKGFAAWRGKTDAELWPAEVARVFRNNDLAVLAENKSIQVTEDSCAPGGRRSTWVTNKFPFRDNSGHRYVAGIALDITTLRETELTSRRNTDQLRAHIEYSPMAVVAWDSEFKVTQWSPQAEKIFGWSAAETLGKPLLDLNLVYEPDVRQVEETMAKLSDGSSRYATSANRNVTKDGRVIHCVWYNSNLLNEDGSMASILSQVLDVSEQKQFEEEIRAAKSAAERANDAKSRFLAAVSHDLRQPLSALSLYIGALKDKLPPEDASLHPQMKDCIDHLSEMLSNLLDLSRLEAGVIKPQIAEFDVQSVLLKIAAAHGPDARSKGLALRFASFAPVGRTDPAMLQRIVSNLVSNAIRYTKRGGVLVGTRRRDGRTWIEVWDTGIGIPAERTTEIFEEFTQLGNSERNVAKGTGLGLAIVTRTARLLGLGVRMHSTLGKGSMFAIELPLGDSLPISRKVGYTQQRLRIALVEDSRQVLDALTYALAGSGHVVVPAATRSEIVSLLGGIRPDLVISDYRLAEEENGLDIIDHLRSIFGHDLPAMIITGDTAPDVIARIAKKNVRVQHKPLDMDVLSSAIAELTREDIEAVAQ